jgi:hypothetical protein
MSLSGDKHPNWKGGRYLTSRGYVMVRVGLNQYMSEHRLVMERMLGRPLTRREHVHHKNGHKTDNRPENLELLSDRDHAKLHWHKDGKQHFGHLDLDRKAECHPDRKFHAKGLCRKCYMNEAQKRYAARNPEKVKERDRRYKQEHKVEIAEYKRRRRIEAKKTG